MGKEIQTKKCLVSVPDEQAEKNKVKKLTPPEVVGMPAKKRKATEDAASVKAKKSKTRKTAPVEIADKIAKPTKSSAKGNGHISGSPVHRSLKDIAGAAKKFGPVEDTTETKTYKTEQPKVIENISLSDDEDEEEVQVDDVEDLSEVDDQTEALLKGFESDGDEDDARKEGGLKPGRDVPKVPTLSNKSKKQIKRSAESDVPEKPGVVYIGRIPHGFYENEMRAYFNQFGSILNLRMSRNRRTGNSKHIAWIQFKSLTVAEIVAKAMDNYLLFNHILKVKIVPDEQIPPNLFKGANKRFKKVPWNKIEGRKLEQGASEATWEKRIEKEEKRRDDKAEKLKEIGYEFDLPKMKSAKNVSKRQSGVLALTADGQASLEAAQDIIESKKPRNAKKAMAGEGSGEIVEEGTAVVPFAEESQKPKKEKKSKVAQQIDSQAGEVAIPVVAETNKSKLKRHKKSKAVKGVEPIAASPADVTTEDAEEKSKAKKAKSALVEEVAVRGESSEEKVRKPKKKKVKAVA